MTEAQHTQEEELTDMHHRVRKKRIRKQLILVSVLNILTFLCTIFAISFYQWIWIKFTVQKQFDSDQVSFWVNLLYVKQDCPNSQYETFKGAQIRICQKSDINCDSIFYSLRFTGYLCFGILFIGILLQLIGFARMLYYAWTIGSIIQIKGNFHYLVLIGTYVIGGTLSMFSLLVIEHRQINFGVSFWIYIASLVAFIIVIIYGQFSLSRMVKQALIQNLLDKQKSTRFKKIISQGPSLQQFDGQVSL